MTTPAEMLRIAHNLEHISKHQREPEIRLLKWGAKRIETLERRLAKRLGVNAWGDAILRGRKGK